MWSMLMEHTLASAQLLGLGIMVIGILWVFTALIFGVMALRKARPEDIAEIIKAFSRWWRRR